MNEKPSSSMLAPELIFTTSRSGGPGGQNVNKVNSKVTLQFHINHSVLLSEEEKNILREKLSAHISKEGILAITSQASRSQLQNKEAAVLKLDQLLTRAFTVRRARKATRPGKSVKRKRLEAKKRHGEKKQWRRKL